MRDGNFLYDDGSLSGGVPVHLDPSDNTVTPILDMVDLQNEIHRVHLGSNGIRCVAVCGDLIAIRNNLSWTEARSRGAIRHDP
ncbi:hypothetical protein JIM95_008700 [Corynebacterium sp. CCM 8835]|uniref:Uncharacterized protein n=1 Tax=Corynebacterium antarcticum TaxID=2800405 RepID=A0ABS1FM44_9CORY|nr:hypothetical protein [Corynebacterium antarcticum]MCK7642965.1 hypothetical protein [Corynebacterium antarcticum]MCL0246211.1 hypothetical protein [Corynebacterium antarcticum]MCX7492462.1 hypothetical protein [Corynebacterium antarcticum]MCX7540802.1 hypothetical protein [Corynebacterium antarcticum]